MPAKTVKMLITTLVLTTALGGLLWGTLAEGTEYYMHVDEVMAEPGANRSTHVPKFEKLERASDEVEAPTVNALEDDQWCAVQVMVERKNVIAVMDQLEQLGATAILETRVTNCRL